MRQLVSAAHLGEIFYVDSVRINLGLFQSDVNVIWDLGRPRRQHHRLRARRDPPHPGQRRGRGACRQPAENIAYLTMRYGPNVVGHVHVNWLAPAKIRRTIVGGSKQMIVYDDMQPSEKLLIYDKGVTIAPDDDPEKVYRELVSYRSGDVLAPRLD